MAKVNIMQGQTATGDAKSPTSSYGRIWDWPAAAILLAALLVASRRLIATSWTENLAMVQTLTFFGTIAGLTLGFSRFSSRTSFNFGLAYGLFFILWQLGAILGSGIEWLERLTSLFGRLMVTIEKLSSDRVVTDPLLFLLLMSILYWALSITAGYSLTRTGHPWRTIIPAGIALVIIHTYDALARGRIWYLAVFLLFALGLVARIHFLRQRTTWQKDQTHMPLYVGVDMMRATFGATALLVVIAWFAPAFASSLEPAERLWRDITEPMREIREDLSNAFTSLQASVGGVTDYYGDNLPLGRGNSNSDQVVLEITTPNRLSSNIRFYWRARAYNYYDPFDEGWEITEDEEQLVLPETSILTFPELQGRWETTFNVATKIPMSVLYTAPQPTSISRPTNFHFITTPAGDVDVSYLRAEEPLLAGENYEFQASVTNASILELRAAGTDYPDWVLEKYLQLPESTTARTLALAQQIAEGYDNPFDVVDAVTHYLRENITYTETVPPIPPEQDPVDWLLFDLKEGFCNYYATAEIVLLRSLGIPARLAVGYAQGERTLGAEEVVAFNNNQPGQIGAEVEESLLENEIYTVRQSDLHAWPEVYFPGIGWVEFEPTLNQEPIVRALGENLVTEEQTAEDELAALEDNPADTGDETSTDNGSADEDLAANPENPWLNRTLWLTTFISGVVLVGMALGWRTMRKRGLQPLPVLVEKSFRRFNLEPPDILVLWANNARLSPLGRAYMEINRALKRLGKPAEIHNTPAERAASLVDLLPPIEEPVQQLKRQYHTGTYSLKDADPQSAHRASKQIRNASYWAWLRQTIARWQISEEQRGDLTTLLKEQENGSKE